MPSQSATTFRSRRHFGKIKRIIDIPNLIDIQKRSYDEFLQADTAPEARKDLGLQGVFKSVFPIKDFNETASLEFVGFSLGTPKYDVEECHQRGMTFAAPLKVTIQLRELGMSTENLLNYLYKKDVIVFDDRKVSKVFKPDQLAGVKATRDVRHPTSNELVVKEGRKFTRTAIKQLETAGTKHI